MIVKLDYNHDVKHTNACQALSLLSCQGQTAKMPNCQVVKLPKQNPCRRTQRITFCLRVLYLQRTNALTNRLKVESDRFKR